MSAEEDALTRQNGPLTAAEIADFRAHHKYLADLRERNLKAIREEIELGWPTAREPTGLKIVSITPDEARERFGISKTRLPWELTPDGYMAVNRNATLSEWRQVETDSPIFVEACMQHNVRTNGHTW